MGGHVNLTAQSRGHQGQEKNRVQKGMQQWTETLQVYACCVNSR